MVSIQRILILGLAFLFTLGAVGQTASGDSMDLSIQDALAKALEKNFDIKVQRLTLTSAELGVKGAYGAYDPTLNFDWGDTLSTQPVSSVIQSGASTLRDVGNHQYTYNLGVTQATPWGQGFSLRWTNDRSKTNSQWALFNPSYTSVLELGTSFPLLRGAGTKVGNRTVLVAKLDQAITGKQYVQYIRDSLQQVESSYWDLRYAIEDLKVMERSLDLAKRFQNETKLKIEVGVLAPIEQISADASVADREQDIITGQALVGDLGDILKLAMGITQDDPEWRLDLIPSEPPREHEAPPYEEDELITMAQEKRPEMKELEITLEKNRLNTHWARKETLPKLDLVGSLWYSGTGGSYWDGLRDDQQRIIPGTEWKNVTNMQDAWDQIWRGDFESWYVGLSFSIPIGNRAAKAQYQQYKLQENSTEIQLQKTQLIIANEVRTALRNLRAAGKRVAASTLNVQLQREKLDAEEKKFQNGLSTSFQVLSYQSDLTRAESLLLSAYVYREKAAAALDVAVGTYLEARDIHLDEPAKSGM